MSYPILSTTQYDPSKYTPIGTIHVNQVEAISLFRSIFGGIGATFGGPNTFIQEAIDRLQNRGMQTLIQKIQQTYPNTVYVNSLQTDISHINGNTDSGSYIVLTMTATCFIPTQNPGVGGGKRRTIKRR